MANDFIIVVQDFVVPSSPDPNRCRVFGFLVDVTGEVLRNSSVHIINKYIPQIVIESSVDLAVLGEKVIVRSDSNGFIQFDVFRNAKVEIMVPSQNPVPHITPEDNPFYNIDIPDAASINLSSLLYPVPEVLEFLDTSPLVLAVDAKAMVKVKLTQSDLFVAVNLSQITLLSSDDSLVTVAAGGVDGDGDLNIEVTRVAVGSAFITAEIFLDATPIRHQPKKIIKFIVNAVEDPLGFKID